MFKTKPNKMNISGYNKEDYGTPVVKIWNLDKIDKTTDVPELIRAVKVQQGNKIFPVRLIYL